MRRQRLLLLICLCACVLACSAQTRKYHGDGIDNYLRWMPCATVFSLKAAGVDGQSSWRRLTANSASSLVLSAGVTYALKHTVHSTRPDGTDRHSFPSGHSAIVFAGATVLAHEYGRQRPWIGVAGYSVATLTALDRVRRNRHHWADVLAGAGIGVASAEAGCWLSGRLFRDEGVRYGVAIMPDGLQIAVFL